jgi:hypothetical protein
MWRPTIRNLATASLGILVIPAILALGMPSSRHTGAAQRPPTSPKGVQVPVAKPEPGNPDEKKALEGFLEAYRLAPGQNLKRVPPPRPAGIRFWYGPTSRKGRGRLNTARAMVLGWRDPDRLEIWADLFSGEEGWAIRELPRALRMGVDPLEVEGDPELLVSPVSGDWIVRQGVPAEELIRPLEAILQRTLRRRFTLTLRQVERDVVVARGRYRPSPLPGHDRVEVEIYARKLDLGEGGDRQWENFPGLLDKVALWIRRRIINEVESPPKELLLCHWNEGRPSTEQTRREDHDETLVLEHLQEQTGLTFTRERRSIRILFVERPKSTR